MADPDRSHSWPVPLIALSGWVLPGLGYFLIGERARAVISGGVIGLTFLAGLLIGGIRVVDVPGYDAMGGRRVVAVGQHTMWALQARPLDEVMNKPWYIAQSLIGPTNVLATYGSLKAADSGHHMSTSRVFDIGTLYTAVAGMLNLLVILDSTYRASRPPEPDPAEAEQARHEQARARADAAVAASANQSVVPPTSGGPA